VYLALAYALLPAIWEGYERQKAWRDKADRPGVTIAGDGHPGDPVNIGLVGSEDELRTIMQAAKWFDADPLSIRSDFDIGADTILKRTYENAPVSNLYLFGRREDLAFEQPATDNPRHRHHVRFWRESPQDGVKRVTWLGSASFDDQVGISHTTGQVTHHIAADVDTERNYLAECLRSTKMLSSESSIEGFHDSLRGRNGGGDLWHTDGDLWLAEIKQSLP
ncbi:MAG: hypothetical protein B7Z54_02075, partial [Sphingobacteriales bacterium 12-47-4]